MYSRYYHPEYGGVEFDKPFYLESAMISCAVAMLCNPTLENNSRFDMAYGGTAKLSRNNPPSIWDGNERLAFANRHRLENTKLFPELQKGQLTNG